VAETLKGCCFGHFN